jgi:hypothetical protein
MPRPSFGTMYYDVCIHRKSTLLNTLLRLII